MNKIPTNPALQNLIQNIKYYILNTINSKLEMINSPYGWIYGINQGSWQNIIVEPRTTTMVARIPDLPAGLYLIFGYICYHDHEFSDDAAAEFKFAYNKDEMFLTSVYRTTPIGSPTIIMNSFVMYKNEDQFISLLAEHTHETSINCDAFIGYVRLR